MHSGPTSSEPLTLFDPPTSAVRTSPASPATVSYDELSPRLPTSGTWGPGGVSLPPQSAPRTNGTGASSSPSELTLLPTPSASNYGTNQGGAARAGEVESLLPTPDGGDARNTRHAPHGRRSQRERDRRRAGPRRPRVRPVAVAQAVLGCYEPAIRRWEHVTGRHAPRPVQRPCGRPTGRSSPRGSSNG